MLSDDLMPLVDAVKSATGHRPHLSTVLRWCQRPNRHGIRLQSWRLGGKRLTTIAAVLEYVRATTAASDPLARPPATSAQQSTAHNRAMRDLEEAGL